jgi:hypothetical protein
VVVAGIAVGVAITWPLLAPGATSRDGCTAPNLFGFYTDDSAINYVPPPANVDDFVSLMGAIVVGTVKSVIGTGTLISYDAEKAERILKLDDKISPALPITDYELVVEKVLLGDGSIEPGESIVLRMIGNPDHVGIPTGLIQMAKIGDHRLYGLGRNPDAETYGIYGWWSSFMIDCQPVTHTDGRRSPVSFIQATAPGLFIKEIEAAVARQSKAP